MHRDPPDNSNTQLPARATSSPSLGWCQPPPQGRSSPRPPQAGTSAILIRDVRVIQLIPTHGGRASPSASAFGGGYKSPAPSPAPFPAHGQFCMDLHSNRGQAEMQTSKTHRSQHGSSRPPLRKQRTPRGSGSSRTGSAHITVEFGPCTTTCIMSTLALPG